MTERIAWSKGGDAALASIDGDLVRVVSTTPAAPGTPLEGALPDAARVRVKVARCKRTADGAFVIEGRLVDASRELRARLAALAAQSS
ncbi:MAG TPA: hypothetical protein VGM56_12025 [Byssovorax sp.]|jgi:hypothetical protein